MRPEVLYPLFAPISVLPGLGPRLAPLAEKLVGPHVADLLWHLPAAVVDRRFRPTAAEAPAGCVATFDVTVERHWPSRRHGAPGVVLCRDDSGPLRLVFFHAKGDWLEKLLPLGSRRIVSGLVDRYQDEAQIAHPDYVLAPDRLDELPLVEAVYPLTAGLAPKILAKATAGALERAPDLMEWHDPALLKREAWPGWRAALGEAHRPADQDGLSPESPARRRLAYDELLANQLALALVRRRLKGAAGRPFAPDGGMRRRLLATLPFALTGAQGRALGEIDGDLSAAAPMLRLLQGDVGSGKTVVAALAMARVVENGAQAALMAPTEILARQHLATLETALPGFRLALLTGRDKGRARQAILDGLAGGTIDVVVGTHALFQEDVRFADLGLAVVDEQHRFGVHQRLDLSGKGRAVDMLVMTATPIPRTLMLTAYGDMDVSRLDEKPPGRRPVTTRVMPLAKLGAVTEAVGRALDAGAKVFWICPLVDESETADLASTEERHRHLAGLFGPRVGLVHGRLKGPQKDAAMAAFAEGNCDLLVATTVVEVGVDVPAATVMVIEHAERFGLAQLHQLRGRIGRGQAASTCLLLYGAPLTATAQARLNILRDSEDGFLIAEEDLRLRGPGEVLGTRQSGMARFRLAELPHHAGLLAMAADDARLVVHRDPDLLSPRGRALRTLLYLFEQDAAAATLRSG